MKKSSSRSPRLLALASAFLLVLFPDGGDAQNELTWNRALLGLTTEPATGGPPGTHDIVFDWRFTIEGDGLLADLGTEAQIVWGTPFGSPECIIWDIKDSCAHACAANDSCGTTVLDGVARTLSCDADDGLCSGPITTGVVSAVPLVSGTTITVTLNATTGSAPEVDLSDDELTIVFGVTAVDEVTSSSWTAIKDAYR